MDSTELQKLFFASLKTNLPPHLSLADELGALLGLSPDSVYRRIRGEKPITLSELRLICEKYHLSLDQLLQLQSDTVVFKASDLDKTEFPFTDILKNLYDQVKYFNSFREKHMLYLCKDMPVWHFFHRPELAAFKTFFWAKTIHNDPAFANKKFSLKEYDFENYNKIGRAVIAEYNQIPGVEIWNLESINSTISQIGYYKDSGGFKYEEEAGIVIDSFIGVIDHLQLQAEKGQKFMSGDSELVYKAAVQLYVNEVVIGSNTILIELDGQKISFIPYNVFSFIFTKDNRFGESISRGINIIQSRSTLISKTGEKERNRFFNKLRDRINLLR
jgi:hypothetical protein